MDHSAIACKCLIGKNKSYPVCLFNQKQLKAGTGRKRTLQIMSGNLLW